MKKALSALLCLCMLLCLSACGDDSQSDLPEGYQLASDPATDGFALYLPDTWTVYRAGNICCGYATSLDRSSVSASPVVSALSPKAYFAASESSYATTFTDFSIEEESEADLCEREAYSVRFTAAFDGVNYCFRQAIVDGGDGLLFVLTCQASTDVDSRLGTSRYAQHETEFADIIAYFSVSGTPAQRPEPIFEGEAPEGMKIASSKKILGCSLAVPESWVITVSDGAVQAAAADGANVGLAKMTPTSTVVKECFDDLVAAYRKLYTEVTVLTEPAEAESVGGYPAYRFRLQIRRGEEVYLTEQLMLAKNTFVGGGAYLLTYTATADTFESHAEEWAAIVEAFAY